MATFHKTLRLLRNEKKLSQQELADAIGVSKSTINMYERGERQPNFETLECIADYFNVNLDFLLGRTTKTTKILQPETINTHHDVEEQAQEKLDEKELEILIELNSDRQLDTKLFHRLSVYIQTLSGLLAQMNDEGCAQIIDYAEYLVASNKYQDIVEPAKSVDAVLKIKSDCCTAEPATPVNTAKAIESLEDFLKGTWDGKK